MRKLTILLIAAVALMIPTAALGHHVFDDVDDGRFYADPVEWAFDNAITTGTSDTMFSPERDVTRGEVVTFLFRYHENLVADAIATTLSTLSCSAGQVAVVSGGMWECGDIGSVADDDTLRDLACSAGELAVRSGGDWVCGSVDDTGHETLGSLPCTVGQVASYDGSDWGCSTLIDSDTLDDLSCTSGQVAKWTGSAWACAADTDTDTDTLGSLSCSADQVAAWSGLVWECSTTPTPSTTSPVRRARWRRSTAPCGRARRRPTTPSAGCRAPRARWPRGTARPGRARR